MQKGTLVSYNPVNGKEIGRVELSDLAEIPKLVSNARSALPKWKSLSLALRKEYLLPLAEKLSAKREELGKLICEEMGKPLEDALAEVDRAALPFGAYLDSMHEALSPEIIEDQNAYSEILFEPYGVCAVIAPWNFPLYMLHWMLIPALMAGNTALVKPSEETPLSAQFYLDLFNESLPAHVLQIIHGDEAQGKALVDADVNLIAFTGSREAGKQIMQAAAKDLKRVVLELGGKDPLIVLDDADIEAASDYAVFNGFRNAGQVCVSTERVYVDEKILPQFEKLLLEKAVRQKVGNGKEAGVNIGPIINKTQRERILKQIEGAIASGARDLTRHTKHPEGFILPTLLSDVTQDMQIMQQETFGPVLCLAAFKNTEEAIKLANDTPFGLGASVYGADEKRARLVAEQIDAGMVGINRNCYGAKGCPWVGAKQSGYGYHSGKLGHRQFAQTKVISSPSSSR